MRIGILTFYLLLPALMVSCFHDRQAGEDASANTEASHLLQKIQYLRDSLANTVNILETPEVGEEFISRCVEYAEAHPGDTASAQLYFEAGNVANSLRQYRRAIELWEKVWQLYPETEVAPHALFRDGFTSENWLKDRYKAKYYYELFLHKYPRHDFVSGIRDLLSVIDRDPEEMVRQFEQQNQTK